jgi:hypothetical protein
MKEAYILQVFSGFRLLQVWTGHFFAPRRRAFQSQLEQIKKISRWNRIEKDFIQRSRSKLFLQGVGIAEEKNSLKGIARNLQVATQIGKPQIRK